MRQHEIFSIFEDLPGHHGCSESALAEAERQMGGRLPPTYRRLMLLDAQRVLNMGVFLAPHELLDGTREAQELLREDGHAFRLESQHVVFAWDDIFAFYYFEAIGSDDVPVDEFNYYSSENDWLPREYSRDVREFFAERIRDYLKI